MLLEEFEDVAGVIVPTDRQIIDKGEVCETIILSFNGEILKRLIESEDVYPGGYLKSINGHRGKGCASVSWRDLRRYW